jgi:hypothetical protein
MAAIRADAPATAAVAGDKRTISGTFTKLKEQGKVRSPARPATTIARVFVPSIRLGIAICDSVCVG